MNNLLFQALYIIICAAFLSAVDTQYKVPYVNGGEISKGSWKLYLKLCGVKYKRFYNLRHTFATKMLSIGFNIVSLSGHLGHSKVTTTMKEDFECDMKIFISHSFFLPIELRFYLTQNFIDTFFGNLHFLT